MEEFENNLVASRHFGTSNDDTGRSDKQLLNGLTRAVELYRDDLLEGCYEDWCLYERERLQGMLLSALSNLMAYHGKRGGYEEAISCGNRILSFDPLLEQVHRELMRLHCLAGNRGAAVRQYRLCQASLAKEMGIEPMAETTALYFEICQIDKMRESGQNTGARHPPPGSGETDHLTSEWPKARPPLAIQMDDALNELRLAQTDFQRSSIRIRSATQALESIRQELNQTRREAE